MAGGVTNHAIRSVTGAVTGKRYVEVVWNTVWASPTTNPHRIGVATNSSPDVSPFTELDGAAWHNDGKIFVNSIQTADTGVAFAANDIVNIAFDTSNGKVWLGRNGTWYNSGDPAAGTNVTATLAVGTWYVGCLVNSNTPSFKASLRTQSSQFTGSIPSGFTAWYTA